MHSLSKSFLCLSATIAILFLLSGCNAFKPDHPQAFQSFREHRLPTQNQLAENGMFGAQQQKKPQVDYTGESATKTSQGSPQIETLKNRDSNDFAENSPNQHPNDKHNQSFFERFTGGFGKLFNREEEQAKQNVAYNNSKRHPTENAVLVAQNDAGDLGLGNSDGASYFDIADEITPTAGLVNNAKAEVMPEQKESPQTPANPTQNLPGAASNVIPTPQPPVPPTIDHHSMDAIKSMEPVKPATTKPMDSSPNMAQVPSVPSDEQMKQEINKQEEPQLYKIPSVDKKAKPQNNKQNQAAQPSSLQPTKVIQHKKRSAKPVKAQPAPESFDSIKTQDSSQIIEENGKHVAKGYLSRSQGSSNESE